MQVIARDMFFSNEMDFFQKSDFLKRCVFLGCFKRIRPLEISGALYTTTILSLKSDNDGLYIFFQIHEIKHYD